MRLVKLTPDWAKEIAKLEAIVYPKAFVLGEEDFRVDLKKAEKKGENFSLGLVNEDGKLVAYLVAYVDKSEQFDDTVVYVSDIAVHPNLQRQGLSDKLVIGLLKSVYEIGLPIEGECRKASWKMVTDHPKTFAKHGYILSHQHKLPHYNGGEDFWWIRLETIPSS